MTSDPSYSTSSTSSTSSSVSNPSSPPLAGTPANEIPVDSTSLPKESEESSNNNNNNFYPPAKRILTPEQLSAFQETSTYKEIVQFLDELNDSVQGVKLSGGDGEDEVIKSLIQILEEVEGVAKDTPVVPNAASRFGNPAFRTFYDRVGEASTSLHEKYLVPLGLSKESIEEVKVYFDEMWGNRTRIDYGSGMELNWLCWILCLKKQNLLQTSHYQAIVTKVFWRYIQVMRYLQSTYWLEPAGSHGVWGLDDYHFLPFFWGSGQLKGHKYIKPRAIHDPEVVEEYSKDYMYFACIQFINSIKTASLRWHSPMLDDISAVKTWDKVNSGMKKMYLAEVLGKLPVMQHFLFGSLLPFVEPRHSHSPSPESEANGAEGSSSENGQSCGHGHAHSHVPRNIHPRVLASLQARGEAPPSVGEQVNADSGGAGQRDVGWGDCCGIPVPSVFAAAAEENKEAKGGYTLSGVRPVPFD